MTAQLQILSTKPSHSRSIGSLSSLRHRRLDTHWPRSEGGCCLFDPPSTSHSSSQQEPQLPSLLSAGAPPSQVFSQQKPTSDRLSQADCRPHATCAKTPAGRNQRVLVVYQGRHHNTICDHTSLYHQRPQYRRQQMRYLNNKRLLLCFQSVPVI